MRCSRTGRAAVVEVPPVVRVVLVGVGDTAGHRRAGVDRQGARKRSGRVAAGCRSTVRADLPPDAHGAGGAGARRCRCTGTRGTGTGADGVPAGTAVPEAPHRSGEELCGELVGVRVRRRDFRAGELRRTRRVGVDHRVAVGVRSTGVARQTQHTRAHVAARVLPGRGALTEDLDQAGLLERHTLARPVVDVEVPDPVAVVPEPPRVVEELDPELDVRKSPQRRGDGVAEVGADRRVVGPTAAVPAARNVVDPVVAEQVRVKVAVDVHADDDADFDLLLAVGGLDCDFHDLVVVARPEVALVDREVGASAIGLDVVVAAVVPVVHGVDEQRLGRARLLAERALSDTGLARRRRLPLGEGRRLLVADLDAADVLDARRRGQGSSGLALLDPVTGAGQSVDLRGSVLRSVVGRRRCRCAEHDPAGETNDCSTAGGNHSLSELHEFSSMLVFQGAVQPRLPKSKRGAPLVTIPKDYL